MQLSDINFGIVCPMANECATAVSFVDAVLEQCRQPSFHSLSFFVVLDHASHDNTLELMRQVEKESPEVRVVWAEIPGYLYNETICDALGQLQLRGGIERIGENLQVCYQKLVSMNLVDPRELNLLEAWLEDLDKVSKSRME